MPIFFASMSMTLSTANAEIGEPRARKAADLGRRAAHIANRLVQQFRGQRAHDEMPLARRPDLGLPIRVDPDAAGMRLDIALVHRRGFELLLDDDGGLGPAGIEIADLEFEP